MKGEDVSWGSKVDSMRGDGRFDVVPADPGAECVYLHVLFPTDTGTAAMPACAVQQKGEDFVVKVGELEYVFKPTQ